jgi:hypothetical protein
MSRRTKEVAIETKAKGQTDRHAIEEFGDVSRNEMKKNQTSNQSERERERWEEQEATHTRQGKSELSQEQRTEKTMNKQKKT